MEERRCQCRDVWRLMRLTLFVLTAKKDLGLVMLPEYIVARDIEKGHLRVIMQDYACEPMEVHAVYPHRKYVSAKVRTFLVFLEEWIRTRSAFNG